MNPTTTPPNRIVTTALASLLLLALPSSAQLLTDDFESYTAGSSLDTSGPWGTVNKASLDFFVLDETPATPFGTPNQYFDFNDNDNSSVGVFSSEFAAASGAVTTFSFDFHEPAGGGDGSLIFGYANLGADLNSGGTRLSMNLDDGAITGITPASTGSNTYSLDTSYRVYVIFNDTLATVNYTGGSVAAGEADVWIQPIAGAPTFAGTSGTSNPQTASYRVGFRSFSSNLQRVLLDNVSLDEGVALPDATWSFATPLLSSRDSIRGRAQSASLGYLVDSSAGGRVGIGGASGDRQDFNIVLGFTLPTLPAGETVSGATFGFEITTARDNGEDPALHVYLLDTDNPDDSGTSFFYQGASDPNTDNAFVGAINLVDPGGGNVSYADDEQDQSFAVTGDALTLLQSLYGGDHIPEQTEVFFRFNLDQELGGATLNNFDRYFIDTANDESSLTITSTAVGGSPYDTWATGTFANPFTQTLPGQNQDNDELTNLQEFAFGTDPTAPTGTSITYEAGGEVTNPGLPVHLNLADPGVDFRAVFGRRKDYLTTGLTYTVQFSAGLDAWVDSTETPTELTSSTGDMDAVSVPYPLFIATPNGSEKPTFFRVGVSQSP